MYCIQYHNCDERGLPIGTNIRAYFGNGPSGIETRRSFVKNEVGSTVFLIVGIGKAPAAYILWEAFVVDDVRKADGVFVASGKGWMLNPPQFLDGHDVDEFRAKCTNFASFKTIDHLPFC